MTDGNSLSLIGLLSGLAATFWAFWRFVLGQPAREVAAYNSGREAGERECAEEIAVLQSRLDAAEAELRALRRGMTRILMLDLTIDQKQDIVRALGLDDPANN